MKTSFRSRRIWREHGGFHLGIVFHRPIGIVSEDLTMRHDMVSICFGLLFWEAAINIEYNHRPDSD